MAIQACWGSDASIKTVVRAGLRELPWIKLRAPGGGDGIWATLSRIGRLLGSPVPGRALATEETLVPLSITQAPPRSLSSIHGFNSLPLHVELSHRTQPCRYVLLGCLNAGEVNVATTLIDRQTLSLSSEEVALLRSAPILVRTGRRSFYSTMLPPNEQYLRYDRACMEPVSLRGEEAMRLIEARLAQCEPARHLWATGDILILDNWRALHGRDRAVRSGRRLARILIDG